MHIVWWSRRPFIIYTSSMNVNDNFSAFWSISVEPHTISKATVPKDSSIALTTAAIVPSDDQISGRVVLYVKVNNGPEVSIVPFTIGRFESATIDLFFAEGDVIEFFTKGAEVTAQVSGYISGEYSMQVEKKKIE